MIDNQIDEHSSMTDRKTITNFRELCEGISRMDGKIAGAMEIKDGKILAASQGAGSALPANEYLSKLIIQVQILVAIPLANRTFLEITTLRL